MIKKVASFIIHYHQYLRADGTLSQPLPAYFEKDKTVLVKLYQRMQELRIFDAKAVALQRTGKMGTFPSSLGQEAIAVGIGHVLNKNDVFCQYYRDHGALFQRGVTMNEVLSYWGGDERGSCFAHNPEDFPVSVPIASQCPHAVGIAYAMKLRQQNRVTLVTCGDGATSKGDFYESINAAGIYQLPLVFVVNNNQWAISLPRSQQTHADTLAQKAIAAGIRGLQVDGNDIIAVCHTLKEAIKQARQGQGPTLIEMLSYRLCDHTTADDAKRYVNADNLKVAWSKEPLARLKQYLYQTQLWSDKQDKDWLNQCKTSVEEAVNQYLNRIPQSPSALFDHLYHTLPKALMPQRDDVCQWHNK